MVMTNFNGTGVGFGAGIGCGFGVGWGFGEIGCATSAPIRILTPSLVIQDFQRNGGNL